MAYPVLPVESKKKKIMLVEPGRFEWAPSETPTPKLGEVLIRPQAIGVCGTDYHAFDGKQNFFSYPRCLGHEIGATVVALGPGCEDSDLKPGDKVAVVPYWECGKCVACRWDKPNCCTSISVIGVHADGGMRDTLCAPKNKLVKSAKLNHEELALVETLCIGAHAVYRASPRRGEKALVLGAGPIGLGTAQFAKAAGCEVTVLDIMQSKLDFIGRTVGIPKERRILSKPGEAEAALAAVEEACGGELPTVVFDATGNIHSMNGAFNYVAHGGKLVFVGHTKANLTVDNPLFHSREMTILASRNALKEDFARTIALVENGEIDVGPWVTHRCRLEHFEANFAKWKDPKEGVIKAMVQMQCEPCEPDPMEVEPAAGALALPKVLFGTSALGNLFSEPSHEEKKAVVEQILKCSPDAPLFDSAGKYGAGLALEELGKCLEELGVPADMPLISNKLGWKRVPLTTAEPTFEPGAWVNLKHDAVQAISYEGILECYAQGNELLGKYEAKIVSVHDPDEYLAGAKDEAELHQRRADVLGAYKALAELKAAGKVQSIGVGAKDVSVIDFISDHVKLDWAMFACSVTPYAHGEVARNLLRKLGGQGVKVINSAVFNAGFLIGSDNFDYRKVSREEEPALFAWRDKFNALCAEFGVKPAEACVQFSFLFPEIVAIALSTTKPSRVQSNIDLANKMVPTAFWARMKKAGLIDKDVKVPA